MEHIPRALPRSCMLLEGRLFCLYHEYMFQCFNFAGRERELLALLLYKDFAAIVCTIFRDTCD